MEHLETKSCCCQSNVIPNTHDRHAGVAALLLGWPLGLSRLKHLLCLKWQQLAAVAKRRGYFERARGQTEWGRQCVRREEGRASCRVPEHEDEGWRARRSGIIRSLCGPLKGLRRKPADETSALTHLGKGGTYKRHTFPGALPHLWDVLVKWGKMWNKEKWPTGEKNDWNLIKELFFYYWHSSIIANWM